MIISCYLDGTWRSPSMENINENKKKPVKLYLVTCALLKLEVEDVCTFKCQWFYNQLNEWLKDKNEWLKEMGPQAAALFGDYNQLRVKCRTLRWVFNFTFFRYSVGVCSLVCLPGCKCWPENTGGYGGLCSQLSNAAFAQTSVCRFCAHHRLKAERLLAV